MTIALRPRSLRVRLTLAFVVLGGALVLAASLGVSYLLGRALWRPLDAALEEEVEVLASIAAAGEDSQGRDHARDETALRVVVAEIGAERDLGPGKFIEVVAADGTRRAVFGIPPSGFRPLGRPPVGVRQLELVHEGGSTHRVAWQRTADGDTVAIGVRADQRIHGLARSRLAVAAGAIAFLAALALLAWQTTSRATAEIEAIATELEALEPEALHRRVQHGDTAEVDRLVVTLNRMLQRVDDAVSHLRRFTADAAHELRTPISALRASIEATLAAPPTVEGYRDGLLDSLEQTERLSHLAEDLLTLSAVEAADSLPQDDVDLAVLVEEVADFFRPIAGEQGRALEISTERGCTVAGSSMLLKRVLINLVDNSFRHTPYGSAVRVDVAREGTQVHVTVRDDGPGFDGGSPADPFRRFARGSSEHAGTGLGLALCQEIVRKHGGSIAIASSSGSGTTVSVVLRASNRCDA